MVTVNVLGSFDLSFFKDSEEASEGEEKQILKKIKNGQYLFSIISNEITDREGNLLYTVEASEEFAGYSFEEKIL